jgi:hypothetical protein
MPDLLRHTMALGLTVGGLLGPGWMLGRALGTPAGLPGAFLGSLAILF